MNDSRIYTASSVELGRGKNLDIILRNARKRGVKVIRIQHMRTVSAFIGGKTESAVVRVIYNDGYFGETQFQCYEHAVEWAKDKSTRKGTHFTGCEVQT